MSARVALTVNAHRLSDDLRVRLTRRQALTMMMFRATSGLGLRAIDFPGGPAYRLAAYVHRLRKVGFNIRMALEDHVGGQHAVYWLEDSVELHPAGNGG